MDARGILHPVNLQPMARKSFNAIILHIGLRNLGLEVHILHGNRLLVALVTADHDTGGLGIVRGRYSEGRARIRWASDGHTAQWVPLFAYGPGAERFGGVLDNTEIGRTVADLLELKPFLVARSKTSSVDR